MGWDRTEWDRIRNTKKGRERNGTQPETRTNLTFNAFQFFSRIFYRLFYLRSLETKFERSNAKGKGGYRLNFRAQAWTGLTKPLFGKFSHTCQLPKFPRTLP